MEKENEKSEEKNCKEQIEDFSDIAKEIEKEEEEEKENLNTLQKEEENSTEVIEKEATLKEKENGKKKHSLRFIIGMIAFIFAMLFFSTIFAIININNMYIIKGVYIEETDVSGFSTEELYQFIEKRIASIEEIKVNDQDSPFVIKAEDIGLTINGKEAIENALHIGKTNHIIIDNYQILKTILWKSRYSLHITMDEEKLHDVIKNIEAEMPGAMKEYSYEIDKDKLVITAGKPGKVIQSEKLKQLIMQNIKDQFNQRTDQKQNRDIPVKEANPAPIDLEKIYQEIYKQAQDAFIIEEPFELHKEEDGIDFAITMEEAKEIIQQQQDIYEIPLKITKAQIAVKDLGDQLFKNTLAKYTTIYDAGNTNRASNIALAAKTINGTILLPGETFSYNRILGNTTKEKGYKLGGAYVAGKVVQAYGGGICQVSTTLYNAALYANLEILERHNHTYTVTYVPAGRDATVSYGGKDFQFKNSRQYPIKIEANAKNGVISVTMKGIKEEKEYEIVLTSEVLSTTPAGITYEKNNNLEEGQEKVIQKGHNGQKSIAYKTIKYNGKTISKTVLSKDTYQPMNKIIEVGTKKVVSIPSNTEPIKENISPSEEITVPKQSEEAVASNNE